MAQRSPMRLRETVAVLAPMARDASIATDVLARARIPARVCTTSQELLGAITDGVGAVVVIEEWLASRESHGLTSALATQPSWSSTPFIVLSQRGGSPNHRESVLATMPNVLLLERPVRLASFLTAIRSALAARARQHELRELLDQSSRDAAERERLRHEADVSRLRLDLLWESAQVLLGASEADTMLQQLFEKIGPHLQLDLYFNYLIDEHAQVLRLASCAGIDAQEAERIRELKFGQAVCGTVALERAPRVATFIQDSDEPITALVRGYGVRAYACSPLMAGERLLGTLSFASRRRDEFSADELDFLRTVCRYVAVAYERLSLIGDLRAADQRKDEFLATLAHELRNPLAPIRQAAMLSRVREVDSEQVRWSHEVIDRQVRHMSMLLDDLLDVSRITRGKLNLRIEAVELASIIDAATETARPTIDSKRHQLSIDLPSEPIRFKADPLRLAQVIANLLTNAAKYTDPGGRIELSARAEAGALAIRVRDNGIGIASHALPRLFRMFSQETAAIERAEGGLGIGLALVKGLVELHGGLVTVASEGAGRGSEFAVHLPLEAGIAQAAHASGNGHARIHAGVTRRVLIADDNRDAAETLGLLLQLAGHEVELTHDGEEALACALHTRPQIALLDIGMPKINGYELARRIREQPWGRDVLLVAVTGWGQEHDRRRALASGFDHHFTKPVDPEAIQALLAGADDDIEPRGEARPDGHDRSSLTQ